MRLQNVCDLLNAQKSTVAHFLSVLNIYSWADLVHLEHLLQLHEFNLFCTDYRIQLELWWHGETITLFLRRQQRNRQFQFLKLFFCRSFCSLSCVKLRVHLLVIMIVHNGLRVIYCTHCYFPTASHVSAARGHCHMPTVSHFRVKEVGHEHNQSRTWSKMTAGEWYCHIIVT